MLTHFLGSIFRCTKYLSTGASDWEPLDHVSMILTITVTTVTFER